MSTKNATLAITALIAILGISATEVEAQASPSARRVWLAAGLGIGTFGPLGFGGVAELVYQGGPHLVALRATAVADLEDGVFDIWLLYGRASSRQGGVGQLSAAIGLSVVSFDGPQRRTDAAIGVPLAVEATSNALFIGLGVKGFANLNTVQSFGGVVLILKLGQLR